MQQSFPLVMDNSVGKASRPDLIIAQAALAEKLKIQLISFTHIQDVEVFGHFENFQAIKKEKVEEKRKIVEIDEEMIKNVIKDGGSVSIRPEVKV